eukprot:m.5376 g.5376  ORF g.5376 m.5376 type:complete len:63 (-) comp4214_c0_seq1:1964-2152(-)
MKLFRNGFIEAILNYYSIQSIECNKVVLFICVELKERSCELLVVSHCNKLLLFCGLFSEETF